MILKYFIDKTTLNYSGSQIKHIKTQKVLKKQYWCLLNDYLN